MNSWNCLCTTFFSFKGIVLNILCLFPQEWTLEIRMEIYHLPLHHPSGRNHENPGIRFS